MPLTIISIFILIALPFLLGWFLVSLLFPKILHFFSERLGVSFGLGLGTITIIEFIFLYSGIKISPFSFCLAISLILFSSFLFTIKRKHSFRGASEIKTEKFSLLSGITLCFIITHALWIIVKAFNLPIFTDDAVAIWGLKAKIIYLSNMSGVPFLEMARNMRYSLSGNYPLLFPLAENYVNLFSNGWNDLIPKIVSPLYYLALLFTFFGLLKRFINKNYALVFTFFLSGLPFLTNIACDSIADVPFAYYYFVSFTLVLLWTRERLNPYLYLSAIFSGFSIWTKNEGYPSFLINLSIAIIFVIINLRSHPKGLIKGLAGFIAISLIIISFVSYYQRLTGVEEGIINKGTLSISQLIGNSKRLPYILFQLQRELLGTPNKWIFSWHLFVLALLVRSRRMLNGFYLFMFLAIILNFVLYTMVYILSPHDVVSHMGTSMYRVTMHFIPLLLFFSATMLFEKEA